MKKHLLLSLVLLSFFDTAELLAAPSLLPFSLSKTDKAYPNRLRRTMRRLHRQAQSRAIKNKKNR